MFCRLLQQCIEPTPPLFPIVKSKVDAPEPDTTDRHPPDVTSGDTAVKEEPQPGTSAGGTEAGGTEASGTEAGSKEAGGTEAGKDEESEEEKYV